MGEAKRRQNLGLPPRENKKTAEKFKINKFKASLNKYPFLPYIIGATVFVILIIDLINYYK
tara:strand:+ start:283 stop:465 length:183 start_codon:yes stop_codon:yes gene_type:complete